MARVLIVEPISVLREHAARLVGKAIPSLASSDIVAVMDCERALEFCSRIAPELIILDLDIIGWRGIIFARSVWSNQRTAKILFWCSRAKGSLAREAKSIASSQFLCGYVSKSEGDLKFNYAVESMFLRENPYFDPALRAQLFDRFPLSVNSGEREALIDVILGLTDRAVARRRGLTVRGVQNRLANLSAKVMRDVLSRIRSEFEMEIYNPRTRLVFEALRKNVVSIEEMIEKDADLDIWLDTHMTKPLVDSTRRKSSEEMAEVISFAPPPSRVSAAQVVP